MNPDNILLPSPNMFAPTLRHIHLDQLTPDLWNKLQPTFLFNDEIMPLRSLSLRSNRINDSDCIEWLAPGIRNNHTIQVLNVNNNRIGDAGTMAIAEALKTNTTLEILNLGGNNISDAGAGAMISASQ